MATITVKYSAPCRACGAGIQAGAKANYSNSKLYCPGCKTTGTDRPSRPRPAGYYASMRDPNGLYDYHGREVARIKCNCEDYPCCSC